MNSIMEITKMTNIINCPTGTGASFDSIKLKKSGADNKQNTNFPFCRFI